MSEELVWEGDVQGIDDEYVKELDLFKIATNTKHLWKLPATNDYHLACEIIIGKGISYDNKSKIMKCISDALGKRPITPQNWVFKDATMKKWGLSGDKIECIKKILQLESVTPETLCKIKEGGIYLVKGFKVFNEDDDDVFFYEHYQILLNIGLLMGKTRPMNRSEAVKISRVWSGYKSLISYFLSRLKPDSVYKIVDEEDLDQYDFFGYDKPVVKDDTKEEEVPTLVK